MRYLLIFCLLHIFGGLFAQTVEYATFPTDEIYGFNYFVDPNGGRILINGGNSEHCFHHLDSSGVLSGIDKMPLRASFGDTTVYYLYMAPYGDGFVTVGGKELWGNGYTKHISAFVEIYNWDFEKIKTISNPKLDSILIGSSHAVIGDTLYFLGDPITYQGDSAQRSFYDVNLYKVNLSSSTVAVSNPAIPPTVDPITIIGILFTKGIFWSQEKMILFSGSIRPDDDHHFVNLDLINGKWVTSKIPGNIYDKPMFGFGQSTFTLAKYQNNLVLCYVSQTPLMEGDFAHTSIDEGVLYFYLLDSDYSVVHKVRYQQEVYKQFSMRSFNYPHFLDFNATTFSYMFSYTGMGDKHPYTQQFLRHSFFGFEFDVQSGEEVASWSISRDAILPTNYNPSVYSNSSFGAIQSGDTWHILFEEQLDFAKRHFSFLSLTTSDMELDLNESPAMLNFSLHPNPFESSIHVALKGQGTFVITDLAGKFMDSGVLVGNGIIDLEELPSGMYLFQLMSSEGQMEVKPIIKK